MADNIQQCECSSAGFCPRYQIEQNELAHSICTGKGTEGHPCPSAKTRLYQEKWARIRDNKPTIANTTVYPRSTAYSDNRTTIQTVVSIPQHGPGTELKLLLDSLGLHAGGCGCEQRVREMNIWGIEGCKTNREKIIAWLQTEKSKRSWSEKILAGYHAISLGLAIKLNPIDPIPGLVDEAIRRAEDKIQ
jgi:hypothetical protein